MTYNPNKGLAKEISNVLEEYFEGDYLYDYDAMEYTLETIKELLQETNKSSKWILLKDEQPKSDGTYLVLRKGFTYDMGNEKDLNYEIGWWNNGRGCFNEDFNNETYLYWTELPSIDEI